LYAGDDLVVVAADERRVVRHVDVEPGRLADEAGDRRRRVAPLASNRMNRSSRSSRPWNHGGMTHQRPSFGTLAVSSCDLERHEHLVVRVVGVPAVTAMVPRLFADTTPVQRPARNWSATSAIP
jgi:hypothetical protein